MKTKSRPTEARNRPCLALKSNQTTAITHRMSALTIARHAEELYPRRTMMGGGETGGSSVAASEKVYGTLVVYASLAAAVALAASAASTVNVGS